MSNVDQQLNALNERLNQAGYHSIDPESTLAELFSSSTDIDSLLQLECLLDCLLANSNASMKQGDHKDLNGAILCLTDGVLQLENVDEARRLVRMLFQMCIAESTERHRRSYYHHFLKKIDATNNETPVSVN